jgi:23S rRNA (cytidine1920-2'-O)/16S rRNA (cytidine1409-2'-O)-methyltransferase
MKKRSKSPALLDLLVSLYPETPRERLFSRVLCGDVVVEGSVLRDPKVAVPADAEIVLSSKRFVSRGGFKLDPALEAWGLPVAGKVFLDAGSSTGGFTDALLQRGARLVHAVDVGTAQLDWKLRADPRVIVREGTNIMGLESLDPRPAAAVADLSFRSLRGAAGRILALTEEGWMVALIKPQFEWIDPPAQFQGVVPDDRLESILASLEHDLREEGVRLVAQMPSAVRGRKGNQEFLAHLVKES